MVYNSLSDFLNVVSLVVVHIFDIVSVGNEVYSIV